MFASMERLHGPFYMHMMRQGDIDRINILIRDKRLIAGNRSAFGGEFLKRADAGWVAAGHSR